MSGFELIAEGTALQQRCKHTLANGRTYILGRATESDFVVPWDTAISRRHLSLTAVNGCVHVERLAEATNPLCHAGDAVERCELHNGDQFVIGSTLFHLRRPGSEPSVSAEPPLQEVTFDAQTMRQIRFRDAD